MGRQSGVLSSPHSLGFLCPTFSVCRGVLVAIGIQECPLPQPQGHRWPMLVSRVLGQEGRVSASQSCSRPYHENSMEHSLTVQPLLHPDATSHQVGNSLPWQSYYCNPIDKNTNFSEMGAGRMGRGHQSPPPNPRGVLINSLTCPFKAWAVTRKMLYRRQEGFRERCLPHCTWPDLDS